MRKKLFSVSLKDCDVQTFAVSGPGGAGKDTSNNGVRVVHRASGAIGEGREERSQRLNKISALRKLSSQTAFKSWVRREAAKALGQPLLDDQIEAAMAVRNLVIERRNAETGKWELWDSALEYSIDEQ